MLQPHPLRGATSYAVQLSLMEVGLGSFLHALRVPFSGFLLSLNQCYILNRALLDPQASSLFLPATISNTAAIIKSLSPYGKKITPMLAISIQGLLFNLGVLLFGKNLLGRACGSILMSLWPSFQPMLLYGAIYSSFFMTMHTNPWFENIPLQLIIGVYFFTHLFLSLMVCLLTWLLPAKLLDRYDERVISYHPPLNVNPTSKNRSFIQKLGGVFKDFTSPLFLFSLLLSAVFFYATLHSLESFFLNFFRLVAIAFLTFFLLRSLSTEWCIHMLSKSTFFKRYTPLVEEVLQRIKQDTSR